MLAPYQRGAFRFSRPHFLLFKNFQKKRVEAIQNELLRREQLAKDAAKKQGHGHAE